MNTELILKRVARVAPNIKITEAYKNYLNRPVIQDFTITWTKNQLIVQAESTIFVHRKYDQLIDQSAFEEKISELRSLARQKQCKLINVNKSAKQMRENYAKYHTEVQNAQKLFAKLVAGWLDYQIHEGYSEDVYYNQYLEPLEFKLQAMHYENTWLIRYRSFMWTLDKAIEKLHDPCKNYTRINIYF